MNDGQPLIQFSERDYSCPHEHHFTVTLYKGKTEYYTFSTLQELAAFVNDNPEKVLFIGIVLGNNVFELTIRGEYIALSINTYQESAQ